MALTQIQLDILSVLKKAQHVLLLPSSPIDGDSLGSSLSLYLALKKLGKKVTVVAEEAVPASYKFLPQIAAISNKLDYVREFVVTIDCRENTPGNVRQEIQGNKINIIVTPHSGGITKEQVSFSQGTAPYDCIVTVDTAEVAQLGKLYDNFTELFQLVPVINIDHHASNTGFGKMNWVDIMAPATTTMVLPLIEELGASLMDADIATLLLAGLITDTGSFQNPNTTPDAFAIAAKLIGYGARQQEIIRNVYKTKKLSTLRLWGRTLTKIQYDEKHKIVWSTLTAKDFAEIGSTPDETEGVIDELMSNAPGTEIIVLLKERGPEEMSGSIRTLTPTIDASKIAALFGGGGHVQAAGFKMKGKTIVVAEQEVVAGLRDFQKKRLRLDDGAPAASVPVVPSAPASVPANASSASALPMSTKPSTTAPATPSAPAPTTAPTSATAAPAQAPIAAAAPIHTPPPASVPAQSPAPARTPVIPQPAIKTPPAPMTTTSVPPTISTTASSSASILPKPTVTPGVSNPSPVPATPAPAPTAAPTAAPRLIAATPAAPTNFAPIPPVPPPLI